MARARRACAPSQRLRVHGDVVELLESLSAAGKPAPTADLLPAAVPEPVVAAAPAAADGELGEGAGEL